jgi:hypothetical protein
MANVRRIGLNSNCASAEERTEVGRIVRPEPIDCNVAHCCFAVGPYCTANEATSVNNFDVYITIRIEGKFHLSSKGKQKHQSINSIEKKYSFNRIQSTCTSFQG